MNQILPCVWLPERARWSYLACSGLPALSRQKNFPESHIINPLLTKLVWSRWLDIGLILFLHVYGPRLSINTQKKNSANIQLLTHISRPNKLGEHAHLCHYWYHSRLFLTLLHYWLQLYEGWITLSTGARLFKARLS